MTVDFLFFCKLYTKLFVINKNSFGLFRNIKIKCWVIVWETFVQMRKVHFS